MYIHLGIIRVYINDSFVLLGCVQESTVLYVLFVGLSTRKKRFETLSSWIQLIVGLVPHQRTFDIVFFYRNLQLNTKGTICYKTNNIYSFMQLCLNYLSFLNICLMLNVLTMKPDLLRHVTEFHQLRKRCRVEIYNTVDQGFSVFRMGTFLK